MMILAERAPDFLVSKHRVVQDPHPFGGRFEARIDAYCVERCLRIRFVQDGGELMRKIQKALYRYRLGTSILALVLLLGVLAVTPAEADDGMICGDQCTSWTQEDGCTKCSYCCSYADGYWWCKDSRFPELCD
jgi:hypothetical protein